MRDRGRLYARPIARRKGPPPLTIPPLPLLPTGPGSVGAGRARSVRFPLCQCGSTRQGPGRCRPLSGAFRPLLPAAALCRCPAPVKAQRSPLTPGGRVRSSASCGRPGRPARRRSVWRRAPCSPLRAHHAAGPGPSTRARPSLSRLRSRAARLKPSPPPSNLRQAKPVTVATTPRKAAPPRHPRQAERVTAARRSACGSGRPSGRSGRFFPVRSWGENRKKPSSFFCSQEGLV